jgi:hypothetical protein
MHAPLPTRALAPLPAAGDVKFITSGHDHINDFCADAMGLKMCYGGGFGYYAYGKVGRTACWGIMGC